MNRSLVALSILLIAFADPAFARTTPAPPKAGSRVRVTLIERDQGPVVGNLLETSPEGLVLAVGPDSTSRRIVHLDIARLEVSRGMKSNAGKGAIVGAVVLGLGGGAYGAYLGHLSESDTDRHLVLPIALLVGGGCALVGAGLGALIGSGSKHENWDRVPAAP